MEVERIAVVTGGNRGIGFAVCEALRDKGLKVILTSRTASLGRKAAEKIGLDYHQLDVTKKSSIDNFSKWIKKKYGRIDVLVNNAGILLDQDTSVFKCKMETLRKTMETNVYGQLNMIQSLLPLMKKNNYGRIVNMSSRMGQLSSIGGNYTAYRMSKTALNAITCIAAAELEGTNIKINSMHPGHVRTRMGGFSAPVSPEKAAVTAVWLATLPKSGPNGKFFHEKKKIDW